MKSLSTRTLLAPALAGVFVLAGCAATGGSSTTADTTSMMGVYTAYKAAWNSHDSEGIAGAFEDGGTFSSPAVAQTDQKPVIAGYTQGLFTAVPDFKVETVSLDPLDADTLVDRWVVTGTWTEPFPAGPLAGAPPTGKSFTLPGTSFIDIENGKISSYTQYWDQMAFLTQIGVIPPPEQAPRASAQ